MPTVINLAVFGYRCKEVIDQLDFHSDDGWRYVCTVRNVAAKISLYQNPAKPKQINYQAFSCGVHKIGFWLLEDSLLDISDSIGGLMKEFQQEAIQDRAEAATQLVQEKRTTHGLNQ